MFRYIFPILLSVVLIPNIVSAQTTNAADFRSTWVLEVSAQICLVNNRDVCILKSATYALSNPDLLGHMMANYPQKIDWFQEQFEQSSYAATKRGRSIYRRILAENAIETLDTFFTEFKTKNGQNASASDLQNHVAIFHFIRAQSCAEQNDDACAIESLRVVKSTMESGTWDQIVARFRLEEPAATQDQTALIQRFGSKL